MNKFAALLSPQNLSNYAGVVGKYTCNNLISNARSSSALRSSRNVSILTSFNHQHHNVKRSFSSKTPANSNSLAIPAESADSLTLNSSNDELPVTPPSPHPAPAVPHFSNFDIREVDEETRMKIHNTSAEIAQAQSYSVENPWHPRRRKEILVMDESEYAGKAILQKKPSLLDRRSEAESHWLRNMAPDKRNNADVLCFIQADIDIRPKSVKRLIAKYTEQGEAIGQEYDPKRNGILGNELAAAHFVVARQGKIKFLGQKNWIVDYRKDAKAGVPEEDLPVMTFDKCTLPVKYDPTFKVEGIDLQGVKLYYEGLANFENLRHVKWISLRDSPLIDDWYLDKIARIFSETLEYIDLSGCKKISDRGIGTFHRCSKLKVMRVENLPHVEDKEIVCAMLEDKLPHLQIIGVDYEAKMEQLQMEGDDLLERQGMLQQEQDTKKLMIEPESRNVPL